MQRKPEQERGNAGKRHLIPDAETRATLADLAWIDEHLLMFRAVVLDHYLAFGKGAVIADTTPQDHLGYGYPVWYLSAKELKTLDEPEVSALVSAYNPTREMVVVLLKADNRQQAYRVLLPPEFPGVH